MNIEKKYLNESLVIRTMRLSLSSYRAIEERVEGIYSESAFHEFKCKIDAIARMYFKHSRIYKIGMEGKNRSSVFEHSRVAVPTITMFQSGLKRCATTIKNSQIVAPIKNISKDLSVSSVKKISIVLCSTVLSNIIFSMMFKKELDLFGLAIRGILFLAGLIGLYYKMDPFRVRDNSFVVKALNAHLDENG